MKPFFPFLVLLNLAMPAAAQQDALALSTQMVVVTTADWNAVDGVLVRYERPHGRWKQVGEAIPVVVGRGGMGWGAGALPNDGNRDPQDPVKKEGDGKAPAGAFRLGAAFGYAAHPQQGWKMPYSGLTAAMECVDDSASRFYNRLLDRNTVSPDWHSSEQMLRSDEAYRLGLEIEHNVNPAVPGGGSCIFMHIWYGRGIGTSGCTAMPREQMETVLGWLDPARNPMLVQLPAAQYKKLKRAWRLPKLGKPSRPQERF